MPGPDKIKWVAIGGGTGLATLLSGLRPRLDEVSLTAIVTVTDDGRSSGRLRSEFGALPPGDIRNCLVALAEPNHPLTRVFRHRFPGSGPLGGHSLGNLMILALSQLHGDLVSATDVARALLNINARVLPSTLTDVELLALIDGEEVRGQVAIKSRNRPIRRLSVLPHNAAPLSASVDAILDADLITLGPGSLYTSVIANLLITGIREALTKSNAMKIFIGNVMTEADETHELSAIDHLRQLLQYAPGFQPDYAVFNSSPISDDMKERYQLEGATALAPPSESTLVDSKTKILALPLASEERFVRHDPARLSRAILDLYNASSNL